MLRYITLGSIIVSDSTAQYRGCTALGFYEHKIVNHSQWGPGRFVVMDDPEAHTQNIECIHHWLKKSIKLLRTDRSLQSYTCTYVYRMWFLSQLPTTSAKFQQFIEDIVAIYTGPLVCQCGSGLNSLEIVLEKNRGDFLKNFPEEKGLSRHCTFRPLIQICLGSD
ncbi:uncharacterized protein LOC111613554 [Centruroides sculpturatus]|uniref:uncharacterized protein LOC111613554 n=1 Tax=Centruroides sculpturatus TaxID=218467 RepID=UPI000C6D1A59|nr:uncharacterized protein LOC111613554 [Centruroides sculpturatus]